MRTAAEWAKLAAQACWRVAKVAALGAKGHRVYVSGRAGNLGPWLKDRLRAQHKETAYWTQSIVDTMQRWMMT